MEKNTRIAVSNKTQKNVRTAAKIKDMSVSDFIRSAVKGELRSMNFPTQNNPDENKG